MNNIRKLIADLRSSGNEKDIQIAVILALLVEKIESLQGMVYDR